MKRHPTENNAPDQQRVDNWLWVSRFYRSRKLASQAVSAGHILINGNKSKPAKTVKQGDTLSINKSHQLYTITILKLSENRLGAPLAALLYSESEQSKMEREEKALLMKNNNLGIKFDRVKPDKRARRASLKSKHAPP